MVMSSRSHWQSRTMWPRPTRKQTSALQFPESPSKHVSLYKHVLRGEKHNSWNCLRWDKKCGGLNSSTDWLTDTCQAARHLHSRMLRLNRKQRGCARRWGPKIKDKLQLLRGDYILNPLKRLRLFLKTVFQLLRVIDLWVKLVFKKKKKNATVLWYSNEPHPSVQFPNLHYRRERSMFVRTNWLHSHRHVKTHGWVQVLQDISVTTTKSLVAWFPLAAGLCLLLRSN